MLFLLVCFLLLAASFSLHSLSLLPSLARSLTHSLVFSLSFSLTPSFTHSLIHFLTYSLTQRPPHTQTHKLTHEQLTYSLTQRPTHTQTHSNEVPSTCCHHLHTPRPHLPHKTQNRPKVLQMQRNHRFLRTTTSD
jgi:hypothetical protein